MQFSLDALKRCSGSTESDSAYLAFFVGECVAIAKKAIASLKAITAGDLHSEAEGFAARERLRFALHLLKDGAEFFSLKESIAQTFSAPHAALTCEAEEAEAAFLTNANTTHQRAADFLVWWTSDADCDALDDELDEGSDGSEAYSQWPQAVPAYIQKQYRGRVGRPGRGRLWCDDGMPERATVPTVANDCAGIVIRRADATALAGLPGFLATLRGRIP